MPSIPQRPSLRRGRLALLTAGLPALLLGLAALAAGPASLEDELGRSETRVRSAAYPLVRGLELEASGLRERLERLGYRRVHARPERPGEYFWGHTRFWIYRQAHRWNGEHHAERLFGLDLTDGRVSGAVDADSAPLSIDRAGKLWLEPETLSESLRGDRAPRRRIRLADLPEQVWRPVLAAEDARFFDHVGLDSRSLARALLANVRAGGVAQGGSTITQQLIKNRELTPKQTIGRKASEAIRALALEADYTKEEILQTYLNQVYLGHVEGLAVHGLGSAAEFYFSKGPEELTLAEAAALAAMIQGPNRLSPTRHPDRLRERRDWVLGRMEELGWAEAGAVSRARATAIEVRRESPASPPARRFLDWVARRVEDRHASRLENGRGLVVETTLDPLLQHEAERAVADHLRALRRRHASLRQADLSAALVALDARDGSVLAYVAGDPRASGDRFDRVRQARRQPGSAIKPLLLLEAFQSCGPRSPLYPSSRVADEPLTIDLPAGAWSPDNFDGRFHGVVDLRTALAHSYNVPFVRLSRWCDAGRVAARLRKAGLPVEADPPPSFALGALEVTPLQLARAYTVFATPGASREPRPIARIEKPGGRRLSSAAAKSTGVVHPSSAWLVRDMMRQVVEQGTGRAAAVEGLELVGKTGSSSSLRDAWFAGDSGNVVTVVWVGRDGGGELGLTGSAAAAPLWREFMRLAAGRRPPRSVDRPDSVVRRNVDPRSGLLVSPNSPRGREEWFRQGATPTRKRFWRREPPDRIIR